MPCLITQYFYKVTKAFPCDCVMIQSFGLGYRMKYSWILYPITQSKVTVCTVPSFLLHSNSIYTNNLSNPCQTLQKSTLISEQQENMRFLDTLNTMNRKSLQKSASNVPEIYVLTCHLCRTSPEHFRTLVCVWANSYSEYFQTWPFSVPAFSIKYETFDQLGLHINFTLSVPSAYRTLRISFPAAVSFFPLKYLIDTQFLQSVCSVIDFFSLLKLRCKFGGIT